MCAEKLQNVGQFQYPHTFQGTLTATVCVYVLTQASCKCIEFTFKKYRLVNTAKSYRFVSFVCFQIYFFLRFTCLFCFFVHFKDSVIQWYTNHLSKLIPWASESQVHHWPKPKLCHSPLSGKEGRPNSHFIKSNSEVLDGISQCSDSWCI